MSMTKVVLTSLAAALAISTLSLPASRAVASHIDWDARRAEREAEKAARDAAREEARAAREAERAADDAQDNEPTCSCSARVSLAKPSVQWSGNVLTLVPRVDIAIRSSGDFDAPQWQAKLAYEGSSSYASSDVAVPGGVSFSGNQNVAGGFCGLDFNHKGYPLPAVTLSGLAKSLVGVDQELEGTVHLRTALSGCGEEEVLNKQFGFNVRELGSLRVGSWRTVR